MGLLVKQLQRACAHTMYSTVPPILACIVDGEDSGTAAGRSFSVLLVVVDVVVPEEGL